MAEMGKIGRDGQQTQHPHRAAKGLATPMHWLAGLISTRWSWLRFRIVVASKNGPGLQVQLSHGHLEIKHALQHGQLAVRNNEWRKLDKGYNSHYVTKYTIFV